MNDADDRAKFGGRSEVFYRLQHPDPVKNLRPGVGMVTVSRIIHSPVAGLSWFPSSNEPCGDE